jgi:hypothetical protein
MKMAYTDETQALMQPDGYGIVGIDPRDHDVLLHSRRSSHELGDQHPADAFPAAIPAHVNAMFDGMLITRRCTKIREGAETCDA